MELHVAINYGGNGSTIAKSCNLTKKEGDFVFDSYFEAFPGLRRYFDMSFRRADKFMGIEFNPVTRRKYLFKEENDYFALREEVNNKYFWHMSNNPREIQGKFDKAKSDIQRLSQNYPIKLYGASYRDAAC